MKPNKPKMKTAKPIKRTTKKTVKKVVRKPKTAKTAKTIKKADPIEATLSALWDWWSKNDETPLSTMVDTTEVLRRLKSKLGTL